MRRTSGILLTVAVALALAAVACAPARQRVAAPPPTTTTTAPPAKPSTCTETPRQSVRSFDPGTVTAADAQAKLIKPGVLTVGVSADTYPMGFRDPETADLQGFDLDLVHEVARALFGTDANRIEYKVMPFSDRLPALEQKKVDLVAHSMTINCARWERINFSTEYLKAGQQLLVRADDAAQGVKTLDQLKGRRVCVTAGGTSEDNLRKNVPDVVVVALADVTDCMVGFQQGTVDAIVSDNTILAGFVHQDPYARVVGEALTDEPYGMGVRKDNVPLTQFVNKALEDVRRTTWKTHYDAWLGAALGAQPVPAAVYGRQP